ncbi:8828_t:CDS:2 [Racocetra persica]|uniref:8828_t:CDS:1 n=1 Tax=Racocetra persica TaxID=160502 RepID=A0ACA9L4M8_9GLOM|nr:8828_t:CDS:2 [Racocetra persica]
MPVNPEMKNPREYRDLWKHITHRRGWGYPDVLDVQGSVFWNIVPLLFFTGLWTVLIVFLYMTLHIKAVAVSSNLTASVSVVVALLLAFRTNNSYTQYNEGRHLFTNMCTVVRNCTRSIWIGVRERNEQDHLEKDACIKLLLAYVVAVKHHIRFEFGIHWNDLDDLLPEGFQKTYYEGSAAQVEETVGDRSLLAVLPTSIRTISNKIPPTVFRSILKFSKEERKELLREHEKELTSEVEADAMIALPFTIVADLDWFTIPTMILVAFIFYGILAVGSEIENPFGYDENDLPLDEYCKDLEAEVKYLQLHLPSDLKYK